jgi:hypothetical protein
MVLVIGKDTQVLNLIDVHEFGLCNDLNANDGSDSDRDVG